MEIFAEGFYRESTGSLMPPITRIPNMAFLRLPPNANKYMVLGMDFQQKAEQGSV